MAVSYLHYSHLLRIANNSQAVAPFNPRPLLQSLYVAHLLHRHPFLTYAQSRQRYRRPLEVGRDGIQGQTRVGRSVHEHPAFRDRGVRKRRQLGHPWTSVDTVQQRLMGRKGGGRRAKSNKGHGHERLKNVRAKIRCAEQTTNIATRAPTLCAQGPAERRLVIYACAGKLALRESANGLKIPQRNQAQARIWESLDTIASECEALKPMVSCQTTQSPQ
jgi:hypothetical protein